MTDRLYYADSYLQTFDARVAERLEVDKRPAVILDRTAFYPTGGGQLNDRGTLGGVAVVDVGEASKGGDVLHVLSEPLPGDAVRGEIDWSLRFDHMQQHTGQHILSQAFIQVAEAETVSFHMSEGTVTIDVNRVDLKPREIDDVEDLANRIVFEDRAVSARFVGEDELLSIPLRRPPKVRKSIRIVEIADFDWSACGGTHVAHTGAIGQIKIVKLDRRGDELRVEFRCGQRALIDYRDKHQMISRVASDLSISYVELDQAAARLVDQNKALRKQLDEAEARVQEYELRDLLSSLQEHDGYALAQFVWPERGMASLRSIAQKLVERPHTVVLLGASGERPALLFARSKDVSFDMAKLIAGAAEQIGGRGGGKPDFAQAGAPASDEAHVRAALDWAAAQLKDQT